MAALTTGIPVVAKVEVLKYILTGQLSLKAPS